MELNEFLVLEIKQVCCTVFVLRYSKLRGIKTEVFFRFSVDISLHVFARFLQYNSSEGRVPLWYFWSASDLNSGGVG